MTYKIELHFVMWANSDLDANTMANQISEHLEETFGVTGTATYTKAVTGVARID